MLKTNHLANKQKHNNLQTNLLIEQTNSQSPCPSPGVVMIRCDIVKGKQSVDRLQSLNKPPWDQGPPRNADGFVLDLGNIGFRGGQSQYPQIRGDDYVEADPLSLQSAGPPQTRVFRNSQQLQQVGPAGQTTPLKQRF